MRNIAKEVGNQLDRWFAALESGDPDQVVKLYAQDAILLSTLKGDVKKGQQKIRDYFEKDFLPKKPLGKTVELHTRVLGGVAVNSGIYSFEVDDEENGRVEVEARYTFVYEWQKDDWKIVEHHSSLNPEGRPTRIGARRESNQRSP